MTYTKLQSLLPNDEIHYINDCENFFEDNELNINDYKKYKFIIFSETVDYFQNTIDTLINNNIKHTIEVDEWNLEYILI